MSKETPHVAAKIKLKRLGKIRTPQYRIIVADARSKRDGRAIEELGLYQPKAEPSLIQVDSERVQYWLGVGAQPTEPVLAILKVTGDWQKYRGLPGAEGTLRYAAAKQSREDRFAAAVAAAHSSTAGAAATTARKPRGGTNTDTAGTATATDAASTATATDAASTAADTSESTQGEAVDPNPTESAKVEAVAEDPTAGGGELPEAGVAADSAPTSGTAHNS
jgi:small subunit ribosomal protein S16